MTPKPQFVLFFLFTFFFIGNLNAQTLIAGWDFQTISNGGTAVLAAPNTPTLLNANFGNGILYCNGNLGSSAWATANQLNSFGGTGLNAGVGFSTSTASPASLALVNSSANGKSIVFSFSMSGYSNLQLSYATQRTSTGFTSQEWEYSVDAINWIALQTITSLPNSFGVQTITNISALNNVSNAYLRVRFDGASQVSGNNRIDNIQLIASSSISIPVVANQSASATVGNLFSYFISATNSPTSYGAIGLPSGLLLNSTTGEISGTPTSALSSVAIPISATNTSGTGNGVLILNITQGNQVINFSPLSSMTYGDPNFTLSASGGNSGNPVSFVSSNPSVATVSGNLVTIQGAGTTVIIASQSGNANYLAANDVSQSLIIAQAPQSILFASISSKLITDPPFTLSVTGGASGNPIVFTSSNPSVATVTGNMVTIVGAGSTLITASQLGNANYLQAPDSIQNLVVNLLPQVISFNALPSKLISDPPFALSASGGSSGNPVLFSSSNSSVATVSGNIVTIVGAGVTTITASQAGNSLYNPAINVPQTLIVSSSSNLATFNFGPLGSPTANATSGLPISNLNVSAITQGNNANTSQTSINISSTSASSNSGASGAMNAGITARNRSFEIDSSAYFEFTLTPSSGHTVTLNSLSFGSRSTGTGPTTLDIRTSINNYSSAISTVSVLSNSTWTAIAPTFSSLSSTTPISIRIYGYVIGGSGSINTGTSPNNWRIDDLNLSISTSVSYPCSLSIAATSTPILCNGGTGTIDVQLTNANGAVNYSLNSGPIQNSPVFTNVLANTYTVSVVDAFLCVATTTIILSEPAPNLVSTSNVNGCNGTPILLTGFPSGGSFSVPNPYSGPSTVFTYSYTDSLGCVSISSPSSITVAPCAVLNLKLFFQSYYVGSGMMASVLFNQGVGLSQLVVDDITIELYDPISFTLVSTATASLGIDGMTSVSFPNISGSYYIAIRYRNGLQAWSASPVTLGSTPYFYDFSISQCNTYGCNAVLVDTGIWAIYSGDLVQDENIDLLDLSMVEADIQNFEFGYFSTDLNGDGNVDLLDMPVLEESIGNFVFASHPIFIVFPETMENGTKISYLNAPVTLSTGVWNFDDALIGTSSSDRKIGAKSARIQNLGKITMNFNVYIDSSIVTIWHAKYSTESNSTWALFKSTDNGMTWLQEGSVISTISTTLQSVTFNVNWVGNIRFEIRKLSGGRLNIDDFNIAVNTGVVVGNDNDHIVFGNPSNAVTDLSFPDNYLVIKNQYDYAYDNSKGSAAWVAWHLDINDIGTTPRCDCFATDVQLPSSFFRANSSNYSGSGFDRGHQVPSSHRNNNITNNAVTFLMSNMMPQAPNLNQITWNNLEQYCTSLVNAGYELYTYSGGYGSGGTGSNGGVTYTIASGNINVPSHFWKIVLALPVGNNDITRVTTSTRVIAVDMPNTQTVSSSSWANYRTSVDAIEAATGFDFFKSLSVSLENAIETVVDNGPTN